MWNQPEFNMAGRGGGYQLRMHWSDISVSIAMDQQHRNSGVRYRF
jgi:hypothetical protein